mgnify:CR=1 FL=1
MSSIKESSKESTKDTIDKSALEANDLRKISDQDFFDLCKEYISEDTVLVGLGATVMAHLEKSLFFGVDQRIVEHRFNELKVLYPWIKTCLGGAQATGATDEYLQNFKFFDYVIKGQGETAIIALLDNLTKKIKLVTNTVTRPKIISDKTYAFNDFNQTINPYRDDDCIQHGEGLPIELARGCIFKCKFCNLDCYGNRCDCHLAFWISTRLSPGQPI